MGKGGKKRGKPGGSAVGTEPWSAADHSRRMSSKLASLTKKCRRAETCVADALSKGYKRSALAHDSSEKRDAGRLRLQIAKVSREVGHLRERLSSWDDVEEQRRNDEEREREQKKKQKECDDEDHREQGKKRKMGRLGPETWKLRGAARPAWEIYDFDTRYECPHRKAHQEAGEKARRVRNIVSVYRGRFGEENGDGGSGPPQPHCRRLLSLLMQLGLLNLEARKFKGARAAFLECMELEGTEHPITNARCRLMRMYLEANRPESARKLWERLPSDPSAWIRYSAALVEFVSWRLLGEKDSSRATAEALLGKAVRANVFCAYHIAYHETFESVVEFAEEVDDAQEGSLEEAIEYCASEQMGAWVGTEGAVEWLRQVLLRALNGSDRGDKENLVKADLDWSPKLALMEKEFEAGLAGENKGGTKSSFDGGEDNGDNKEDHKADLLMYAGMFRTAMDMLQDAGEFLKVLELSDDDPKG